MSSDEFHMTACDHLGLPLYTGDQDVHDALCADDDQKLFKLHFFAGKNADDWIGLDK
jgi:hypothetical protein